MITGLSENTFKNAQFTFQIGLHKDDEPVLNYIINILKCVAIMLCKKYGMIYLNQKIE